MIHYNFCLYFKLITFNKKIIFEISLLIFLSQEKIIYYEFINVYNDYVCMNKRVIL